MMSNPTVFLWIGAVINLLTFAGIILRGMRAIGKFEQGFITSSKELNEVSQRLEQLGENETQNTLNIAKTTAFLEALEKRVYRIEQREDRRER